jgi:hypothetical protein
VFGKGTGRIFGPKRAEIIEGLRQLYNEELHNLYALPNIIRMIKSRRVRVGGNVAPMGAKRNVCNLFDENP